MQENDKMIEKSLTYLCDDVIGERLRDVYAAHLRSSSLSDLGVR
jgi:hypothetical protein